MSVEKLVGRLEGLCKQLEPDVEARRSEVLARRVVGGDGEDGPRISGSEAAAAATAV